MNKIEDYDINLNCEGMDGIRPMPSVSWSTIKFSPWLTSMYQTHWKINLVFYQKWKDTCTFILTSHPSTVQVKDCIEHTITGRMWVICPVSSNTITDVEMVWVTAADIAAAPVYHKTKKGNTYNYDLFWWKLKEMRKSSGGAFLSDPLLLTKMVHQRNQWKVARSKFITFFMHVI